MTEILELLRAGVPLTLLIDLVDPALSSEQILDEEQHVMGSAA